ncbi:hypothetical protein GIB67_002411 [Kingdonia uniflora]|uniref:Small auxin up regulated protein n=1 Tax=Kingdonia uniflora TaxID=39325 RepID=A0A7J7L9B2_9MAGN|nr:hypothetical protein GIB67_002411 [Kingdonia uniflora]
MGIRLPSVVLHAKQILKLQSLLSRNQSSPFWLETDPCSALIYAGDKEKKQYVVPNPISYLNNPSFQHLISRAEDKFGSDYPMGGLTIPCKEFAFINFNYRLSAS